MHSANIIHFYLRPQNILVNDDCHVKIKYFYYSQTNDIQNKPKPAGMVDYSTKS